MASPTSDIDYEFVEKLPEDLTCSICMKVLNQPHLVNCCGQQYCEKCLRQWQKQNKTCPQCRCSDYSHMLMKQTSRKIGELKVYCPNKKHGCQTIIKISEFKNHLDDQQGCKYVEVACPYLCKVSTFRCQIDDHKKNLCEKRPDSCKYCNTKGKHQFIVGDHVNTCPSYPLSCPQNCGETVLRKNLKKHREECPLEAVPCPFTKLGCKIKVQRKDLKTHVESSTLEHMATLVKSHISLQADHMALKDDYAKLKTEHASLKAEDAALKNLIAIRLRDSSENEKAYDIKPEIAALLSLGTNAVLTEKSFTLSLPKNSIDHIITISEYQFKVEVIKKSTFSSWTNHSPRFTQGYRLNLYIIQDEGHSALPYSWNCDVKVRAAHEKVFANLTTIRQGSPSDSRFRRCESPHLLGSIDYIFSSHQKEFEIYFSPIE